MFVRIFIYVHERMYVFMYACLPECCMCISVALCWMNGCWKFSRQTYVRCVRLNICMYIYLDVCEYVYMYMLHLYLLLTNRYILQALQPHTNAHTHSFALALPQLLLLPVCLRVFRCCWYCCCYCCCCNTSAVLLLFVQIFAYPCLFGHQHKRIYSFACNGVQTHTHT